VNQAPWQPDQSAHATESFTNPPFGASSNRNAPTSMQSSNDERRMSGSGQDDFAGYASSRISSTWWIMNKNVRSAKAEERPSLDKYHGRFPSLPDPPAGATSSFPNPPPNSGSYTDEPFAPQFRGPWLGVNFLWARKSQEESAMSAACFLL